MKKIIYILTTALVLLTTSCDDILDRPPKTGIPEDEYWLDSTKVRLYANRFYPNFFVGYNTGYSSDYTPMKGYHFSDDLSKEGDQLKFEDNAPPSRGSLAATTSPPSWLASYAGPTWYFGWVRDANIMATQLVNMKSQRILTEEQFNHWSGIARFFRGLEYSRLVGTFGDVPYFDIPLDPEKTPLNIIYKDREPRGEVMDKVYDDFQFAFKNVRINDGDLFVNKYIVASFIARWMLNEGTWQKYHYNDNARAQKYLKFAMEAADFVIKSGKYEISGDYRSLFTSLDLKGHKEIILYRKYSDALNVKHSIASAFNREGQTYSVNLNAIKSYLCVDGKPYQTSTNADRNKFDVKSLIKSRDSRFEATFYGTASGSSASLLYGVKFCPREAVNTSITAWTVNNNVSQAPVMRYSEVLLIWLEAKAELQTMGGVPVTQPDIELTINAIRNRPLAPQAIAAGVSKTAPLTLVGLAYDPDNIDNVPDLIWEIRRERRMEFMYEHTRLTDIRRWKELDFMDNTKYSEYKLGVWINGLAEVQSLSETKKTNLQVKNANDSIITYSGNDAEMVGFYMIRNANDRPAFSDRSYLSPIGRSEIEAYKQRGYTLTQTRGW